MAPEETDTHDNTGEGEEEYHPGEEEKLTERKMTTSKLKQNIQIKNKKRGKKRRGKNLHNLSRAPRKFPRDLFRKR